MPRAPWEEVADYVFGTHATPGKTWEFLAVARLWRGELVLR